MRRRHIPKRWQVTRRVMLLETNHGLAYNTFSVWSSCMLVFFSCGLLFSLTAGFSEILNVELTSVLLLAVP